MREHPHSIRYALLATFVHVRLAEVTDDVIKMLVEIIQHLDRRSDQQLYRELLRDLERVEGKIQILFRVAEVVTTKPEGTIREVLFPIVKEETFRQLVLESRNTGPQFRLFGFTTPVSAVLKLKVDDYFHNGARRWLRLHEKGGKEHEMPVHHLLEGLRRR